WRSNVSHQRVNGLAFSHDATKMASVGLKGTIALLDSATGRVLSRRVATGKADPQAVAFSTDDSQLYVAFSGGAVRVADVSELVGDSTPPRWQDAFVAERGEIG